MVDYVLRVRPDQTAPPSTARARHEAPTVPMRRVRGPITVPGWLYVGGGAGLAVLVAAVAVTVGMSVALVFGSILAAVT